jgi:hypothetical protein
MVQRDVPEKRFDEIRVDAIVATSRRAGVT